MIRLTRGVLLLVLAALPGHSAGVFPQPKSVEERLGSFLLDESVVISIRPNASAAERSLPALLSADLVDRFRLAVRTVPVGAIRQGTRTIELRIAGARCAVAQPEGYTLTVTPERILIEGRDQAGAFYGVQSLRQLVGPSGTRMRALRIRDWPSAPFRGIKLYLPGRENVGFYKRFLRDFMALYKFNKLFLELNAGMRLDRHPEVNAGWFELGENLRATRRERPAGPRGVFQDSVHHDTADFGVLEKQEVADMASWAEANHVEVIPEIPTLTHSYYLLARHRELAEIPDAEWPDTFCPSLPGTYKLIFDVLDEYIGALHPKMVHIGHDEWRIPFGVCPRCRNKDPRELYAADLKKIYDHLTARGIKVAIWGDHLIEPLRGKRVQDRKSAEGVPYHTPGGLTPDQVRQWIPKDILIMNWFWDDRLKNIGLGEQNERNLAAWGFRQIYGNMTPDIQNYSERSRRNGILGGAPSSWAATTPMNFGKDLLGQFLGCASMLWSNYAPPKEELIAILHGQGPAIADSFAGVRRWSETEDPVTPIPLPAAAVGTMVKDVPLLAGGTVQAGKYRFVVGDAVAAPNGKAVEVPVNQDASSLVFLHASLRPAASTMSYRLLQAPAETADLAGWYEVVYEDGFVTTISLRADVNIHGWKRAVDAFAYQTTSVELKQTDGSPAYFAAFEWENPRLGKVIREVRLHAMNNFLNWRGRKVTNGVILAGLSYVPKRKAAPAPTQIPIPLE